MRDAIAHSRRISRVPTQVAPMRFASKYATEPSYVLFVIAGNTLDNIRYLFRPLTAPRMLWSVFVLWADGFTPMLKSGSVYHVTLSSALIVVFEYLYRLQTSISDSLERSMACDEISFLLLGDIFCMGSCDFLPKPTEPRTSVENPHTKSEIYPVNFRRFVLRSKVGMSKNHKLLLLAHGFKPPFLLIHGAE